MARPLVKPALAALASFVFLGNWTAFLWPPIVTISAGISTLPVGLSGFSYESDVASEPIMTGAAISTFSTLVVFLIFRRFILRGVAMAGPQGAVIRRNRWRVREPFRVPNGHGPGEVGAPGGGPAPRTPRDISGAKTSLSP